MISPDIPFLGKIYCRLPGFTVMPSGKYLAGGLQSGCTANSTGVQYKLNSFNKNSGYAGGKREGKMIY